VTILLSGPSESDMTKIKQHIRPLFKLARHILLEKSMILLNQEQINTMKKNQWQDIMTYGDFTYFLFQNFNNIEEYINSQSISYKKINYVVANWQTYNDINSQEELDNYIKDNPSFNNKKIKQLTEICEPS
jgi:hypothetical protein